MVGAINPSLPSLPQEESRSFEEEWNLWPLTKKEVFILNCDRDWLDGVLGISNGFKPSGKITDWAQRNPFITLDKMLGCAQKETPSRAMTVVSNRRPDFVELYWINSM